MCQGRARFGLLVARAGLGSGQPHLDFHIFGSAMREKQLQSILKAEWTVDSVVSYEEEVYNYGLFDVVFDHTFYSREHPFLRDKILEVWEKLTATDFVGTRPPLSIAETHAVILATESDVDLWYVKQLLARLKTNQLTWPADMQVSPNETLALMRSSSPMEPSLWSIRQLYSSVQKLYASTYEHEMPSIAECMNRLAVTQQKLQDFGRQLPPHPP